MADVEIKSSLKKRGEQLLEARPQVLPELVERLVTWLAVEDRLDLKPSEIVEARRLLLGHLKMKLYHTGVNESPLRARLDRIGCDASYDFELMLERLGRNDHFVTAMQDSQFTVEVLPAGEFVLDLWDPEKPKAMTFEEAQAEAKSCRDYAAYLDRLAGFVPAEKCLPHV